MDSKAQPQGAPPRALGHSAALELRIGHETVKIWFDDNGIHFRHAEGRQTEGVLPWDVAMAMSLVPEELRTPLTRLHR